MAMGRKGEVGRVAGCGPVMAVAIRRKPLASHNEARAMTKDAVRDRGKAKSPAPPADVDYKSSHTEVSAGDDIIDLVQDIENLPKDDAIARLLELEERHEPVAKLFGTPLITPLKS